MGLVRPKFDGAFIRDYLDRLATQARVPQFFRSGELNVLRTWAVAELTYSSGILPVQMTQLVPADLDCNRLALKIDGRWIPITSTAYSAIRTYRRYFAAHRGGDGKFLFSSTHDPSKPVESSTLTASFRFVGDLIGFRVTPQNIQHAFVVEMKERGMSVHELAYITGVSEERLEYWRRR